MGWDVSAVVLAMGPDSAAGDKWRWCCGHFVVQHAVARVGLQRALAVFFLDGGRAAPAQGAPAAQNHNDHRA